MNLIKLAYKNLMDKPLNLILSLILFALGVGLINFLLLFNHQLKDKFEANLADIDLVVGAKGSPLQLILCNMYHIDNPTGNIAIKDAKPFFNPKHPVIASAIPLSLGDNYKSFRIVGTIPAMLDMYEAKIGEGKMWGPPMEVVIGKMVAQETGLKIGDHFVSSHGLVSDDDLAHDHAPFTVTGILEPTGSVIDQLILTQSATIWQVHEHEGEEHEEVTVEGEEAEHHHHSHEADSGTLEDLLSHEDQSITSILIKYRSKTSFQALNMPRMINENTSLQAASPAYEINKLIDLVGVGTDGITAIAYLIAFVSALSIFISLYRAMKERKYELAIMRVMGGSRFRIFVLIVLEGMFLALIGWMAGIVLSHAGMEILAGYMQADFRYSFTGYLWLQDEWKLLAASLLIGFISAIIPALTAARKNVMDVLS